MFSHKLTKSALTLGALLFCASGGARAQYAIKLFAGSGPSGLPATSSSIGYPGGVARDGLGNTYIVDSYTNRVFKVDPSGNLTVFAGNDYGVGGEGGYSGDGGPATSAELGRPEGIALDGSGNVFIADTDNSVIREVVAATGTITTVAGTPYPTTDTCNSSGDGGLATSAYLCQPGGVFVDGKGNLFIADTANHEIREVVAATGNIQTVAGSGTPGYSGDGGAATSAQLDLPGGVFVDGFANIFIADTYNSVIREVVAATGNIQTVAGSYYAYNFTCNFSGDGALATSAQLCLPGGVSVDGSGNIFIADTFNFEIREVVASTGDIQDFAGTGGTAGSSGDGGPATSAELNDPNGLFVDASDNVYIADTENFVIREVSGGTIQTVVGNHTVAFSGDGGAATSAALFAAGGVFVDASDNVFIADTGNCVIREVIAATGNVQTVAGNGSCGYSGDGAAATSAQLNDPDGVFVDSLGDIFIADTDNSLIREVVAATGFIQTVAGNAAMVGIGGYSGDGGAATSAQLNDPQGVFVDNVGDIFIADTDNSAIRCVVGTAGGCFGSGLAVGDITTVAGTPAMPCSEPDTACGDGGLAAAAQLNFPAGIFGDATGDLFIADTLDSRIREVVAATLDIQTVAGTGVAGYSGDGGLATSGLLDDPYGVFVDGFGNIFIADSFNSVVREVVAVTGDIQTIAGNGTEGYAGDGGSGNSAELAHPLGITGDAAGNLFVADTENSRVRELTSTVSAGSVPTSATVPAGASQQFAATVTGASNTSVTWQVNGVTGGNSAVGSISSLGSYQAPSTIPSPSTVTVIAVANANGVNRASAQVKIVSAATFAVTVSTNPAVAEVYTGTTQAFVANVQGSTNPEVTWQVNGVAGGNSTLGTISSAGTYSAPPAVPAPATIVIGAVPQADSKVSASYPVVLVASPTASEPAPQTISAGDTATFKIALNPNTGDPKQPITLACLKSSLPQNATCTFSPSTITPGRSAVPFTLNVNVPAATASLARSNLKQNPLAQQIFGGAAFLPMVGVLFLGLNKRGLRKRSSDKRKLLRQRSLFLLPLCISLGLLVGCGGSGSSTSPSSSTPQSFVYSVQVQGTTLAQPNAITITTASLTVQ